MRIGFIGAGNMACAIAAGLRKKGLCSSEEIECISASGKGANRMRELVGATIADSRCALIGASDIVILAFKPQHLEGITEEESQAAAGKLVISVLAGRTIDSLSKTFPSASNIVRVMPNTPAQIGKGVSTFCFGIEPSEAQNRSVNDILSSLGTCHQVDESQLHIATVINGCGPAFYFRIAQLIGQNAAKHGLDSQLATRLAYETAIGSYELMSQSEKAPQALIDEVVSPNGVTHALLTSLDRNGFPDLIDQATQDAINRSIELSRP